VLIVFERPKITKNEVNFQIKFIRDCIENEFPAFFSKICFAVSEKSMFFALRFKKVN